MRTNQHRIALREPHAAQATRPGLSADVRFVRAVQAVCERLEERQLLAAAPAGVVVDTEGLMTITGTKKHDVIVVRRDGDAINVGFNGVVTSHSGVTSIQAFLDAGNDSFSVNETDQTVLGLPLFVDGGAGHDRMAGSRGDDHLVGGKGIGRDVLLGNGGNDILDAGGGDDRLLGHDGDDTLITGKGKDFYNGGAGNNTIETSGNSKAQFSPQALPNPLQSNNLNRADPLTFFGTFGAGFGLTPDTVRATYQFHNLNDPVQNAARPLGNGQAVAVVIPYTTVNITGSLDTFAEQFGLPEPDSTNFEIVDVGGTPIPDPDPNHGWEVEAATDLQWIRAIAPNAKLYLFRAQSDLFPDLFDAVDAAVDRLVGDHGGGVVCLTIGSQNGELAPDIQATLDQSFTRAAASTVTFVAGSGDVAATVSYPAISPFVTAVGGTSLQLDSNGVPVGIETAWNSSGGGNSGSYPAPDYQQTVPGIGFTRSNPDVAYNADPASGIAVFSSVEFGDLDGDMISDSGWVPGGVGGTSAGTPQWAGLVALANQVRLANGRGFLGTRFNHVIYDLAQNFPGLHFNDITTGNSGANAANLGYDEVTGWGSPKAGSLIDALSVAETFPFGGDLEWEAFYQVPITQVGPLLGIPPPVGGYPSQNGAGGGFFVGEGTATGASTVNIVLTPKQEPVQLDLGPFTTYSSPEAILNSLTINPLQRDPLTGKLTGTGTAVLTVTISTPVYTPPPPPPPVTPVPGSPPTSPTTPTPTPAPTPTPTTPTPTPTTTVVRTTTIVPLNLQVTGKVIRNQKNGAQRIRASFTNVNPDGSLPREGFDFRFEGKFKS